MGVNKDELLLEQCISDAPAIFQDIPYEHPLDQEVLEILQKLHDKINGNADDFYIFRYRQDIVDPLWEKLIEKAIKCLRYCDSREPFKQSESKKSPKAYGIQELKKYYNEYTEFERLLYGSSRYYRDHVIHVFRTWLSGAVQLVKNDAKYLDNLQIHEKNCEVSLSREEKLSMWTIIALTHDLGYPLQKAKDIINTTRSMVSTFISDPDISMDFSFHGVQNYMNDFVVRLMSSKMIEYGIDEHGKTTYAARLQPKYYFKFQKSLESNKHGILSTLIIYKLLTYFLESDYNINEDYKFGSEDRRQFYIRREILRAIASHTCDDIYQLYMTSFSFLLRICDDTQEWGRKNISELYVNSSTSYELKDIDFNIDSDNKEHTCVIEEAFTVTESSEVVTLINRLREQSLVYVTIFRDGQDTILRNFSFTRKLLIKYQTAVEISLDLEIPKDDASRLTGRIKFGSDNKMKETFGANFYKEVCIDWSKNIRLSDGAAKEYGMITMDAKGEIITPKEYKKCKYGDFTILLTK